MPGDGSGSSGRRIDDVESVELEFASFRRFQEEYLRYLSTDGLFVASDDPLPPSTVIRFRVRLPEDVILIEGTGVVVWTLAQAGDEAGPPPGMAVRFVALGRQSKDLIEKLVRGYEAQGGVAFDLDARAGAEEEPSPPSSPPAPPVAAANEAPKAPPKQDQIRFTVRGADSQVPQPPSSDEASDEGGDDALARTVPERPILPLAPAAPWTM